MLQIISRVREKITRFVILRTNEGIIYTPIEIVPAGRSERHRRRRNSLGITPIYGVSLRGGRTEGG